jgi:hypothetical protein
MPASHSLLTETDLTRLYDAALEVLLGPGRCRPAIIVEADLRHAFEEARRPGRRPALERPVQTLARAAFEVARKHADRLPGVELEVDLQLALQAAALAP